MKEKKGFTTEYPTRAEAKEQLLAFIDTLRGDIAAGTYDHENSCIAIFAASYDDTVIDGGNNYKQSAYILMEHPHALAFALMPLGRDIMLRTATVTALSMTNQNKKKHDKQS